jgi:putative transposase
MHCILVFLLLPRLARRALLFRLLAWLLAWLLAGVLRRRRPRRRHFHRRAQTHAIAVKADAALLALAEPAGHWRKKPRWVECKVMYLATYLRGARTIADAFNKIHGHRDTVRKTWVAEFCKEHAAELRLRRRGVRGRPADAIAVRSACSLDLTFIRAGDRQHCIFGLIDQGSRAVLRLKVIARKCTWTLLGNLCFAIADFGLPKAIRTDNEGMFTGKLWATALRWAGIAHERISARCPWQNGRIERFFGTLKPVLNQLALPTAVALQAALDEFAGFYNHARGHQGLGGLTPAQAWRGVTHTDARRCAGQGQWVQAFGGLLLAYRLRC